MCICEWICWGALVIFRLDGYPKVKRYYEMRSWDILLYCLRLFEQFEITFAGFIFDWKGRLEKSLWLRYKYLIMHFGILVSLSCTWLYDRWNAGQVCWVVWLLVCFMGAMWRGLDLLLVHLLITACLTLVSTLWGIPFSAGIVLPRGSLIPSVQPFAASLI